MSIKKIEGTLVYVNVKKPKPALIKPGAPRKPDEWSAAVVVTDKSVVKAFQKYGKELDTLISVKEVESSEFEEKYKCELPEGAGNEVWVIKLRKSVELGKTGESVPDKYRPRVFHQVGNTRTDITFTQIPGNGSKGAISIDTFMRTTGGGSLYLKNVLVTDLIEYIEPDSEESGSEFDDDEGGTSDEPKVQPKVKAPAKTAAKKKVEDEFDDDIPF